jgi:hypothetical protein
VEDGLTTTHAPVPTWRAACHAGMLETRYFDSLRAVMRQLSIDANNANEAYDGNAWPKRDVLNAIAQKYALTNAGGVPLRFVESAGAQSARHYEMQIAMRGEIQTRENFHDTFNALVWLAFPKTKSIISELHACAHALALRERRGIELTERSRERDVLTMFDESGIIVASDDESLLELVRDFRWQELFVQRRIEARTKMRFQLVGHGVMEKALSPFVGLTAKAILLHVSDDTDLDLAASDWLHSAHNLQSSMNLSPLPLLGIPDWDARNEDATFYDNTQYFRPGRMRFAHTMSRANPT